MIEDNGESTIVAEMGPDDIEAKINWKTLD